MQDVLSTRVCTVVLQIARLTCIVTITFCRYCTDCTSICRFKAEMMKVERENTPGIKNSDTKLEIGIDEIVEEEEEEEEPL